MEACLKFNSQVCTDINQSKKLLELGLKPETADMYYHEGSEDGAGNIEYHLNIRTERDNILFPDYISAWSLHRLLYSLMPNSVKNYCLAVYSGYVITYDSLCGSSYEVCKDFNESLNIYDNIIDCIEWLISNGYFNKEYLKQCQTKENTESI